MTELFVRCYIGDISLITLRSVQRESGIFDEWELFQGSEFDRKQHYGYKKHFDRDELLLEGLAKRSVIAEARQPDRVKPSLIWNNVLNFADVITLLSLARAKYYPTLAVERGKEDGYSIAWGVMTREEAENRDIISISNLGLFVSEALTYIENNSSWLIESGFNPSIFWYQQAQQAYGTAPSIMEMGLYWVSVEILASTYVEKQGLDIPHKKERVKRFINDKGYIGGVWGFLDEVINDWYAVRNDLFHEGTQHLPVELLSKRRQQVRDFTSLVLVEMLQPQGEERRKEIATRMQNY